MKSTPLEQCEGKTLRGSVFHNSDQYLLLVWSDGCVTELCSEGGEDDSNLIQTGRWSDIDFYYYDHDKLIEAGMDSDFVEGLKKAKQAKLDEQMNQSRAYRQAQYERLKKEFEGGST